MKPPVTHHDGVLVLLEGRHRPHVTHTLFNGLVHSVRLCCAYDEDKDLLGAGIYIFHSPLLEKIQCLKLVVKIKKKKINPGKNGDRIL